MVKAGELNQKIKVERPTRTSIGGGAFDTTYDEILSTFAAVKEQRSSPEMVADQENIYNYVHFKIRYRPDVFLNIGDRLVWRGFNYIVNNIKVDPMRTQIDIYVNAEMETSKRGEPIPFEVFDESFDETFN